MEFAALELPAELVYAGLIRPPPIHDNIPTDEDILRAIEFNRQVDTSRSRADRDRSALNVREVAEASIYAYKVIGSRGPPAWLQPLMTAMSAELRKVVSDEVKQAIGDEMKRSEERMTTRFSNELKQLRDEMKRSEQRLSTQFRDELKQLRDEMKRSEQRLSTQFRDELKKLGSEIKDQTNQLGTRMTAVEADLRKVYRLTVRVYVKMARRDNGYFNAANDLDEVPFADGTFPWDKIVAGPTATGNIKLPPLSSVQAVSNLSGPEVYGYFKGYCPAASNTGTILSRKKKILTAIGRRDVMPPPTA